MASVTLLKGIRTAVDRIYYGDWYDYRKEVQQLSHQLGSTIAEANISQMLTRDLPSIMRIERAILVLHTTNRTWRMAARQEAISADIFNRLVDELNQRLAENSGEESSRRQLVWQFPE